MSKDDKLNELIEGVKKGVEEICGILNSHFFKNFNIDAISEYKETHIEFMKILFNQCGTVLRPDDTMTTMTLLAITTMDISGIQKVATNLETDYVQLQKYPEIIESIKQNPALKYLIENNKTLPYYQKISEDYNQREVASASVYIKFFISYLQKTKNKYDEVKDDFEYNLKKELDEIY